MSGCVKRDQLQAEVAHWKGNYEALYAETRPTRIASLEAALAESRKEVTRLSAVITNACDVMGAYTNTCREKQ
jgi:hypothetical protein